MSQPSLIHRLRNWLAERFFQLAGLLDPAYDVWLDKAEPRHNHR